ncbi:pseudouridine synthase [Entophlyctis helioformis]|nr:pseudouridine synthase [Entophlyctis helioformis]
MKRQLPDPACPSDAASAPASLTATSTTTTTTSAGPADSNTTTAVHPAKAAKTENDIDQMPQEPISKFPLGRLSAELNLQYEAIYLAAQKKSADAHKDLPKGKAAKGPDGKTIKVNPVRTWGPKEPSAPASASSSAPATPATPATPADSAERNRRPKKKVALLMSYCGTGYQGMQITPHVPSIELDLHKAIAASGAVSPDNAMDPAKTGFVRCARTDKGVHAAGQVVSLKLIVEDKDIVERINSFLPPQIRVWGYSRVPKHFHAKNYCDSRIYEYLLPTYILAPVTPSHYPMSSLAVSAGIDMASLGRERNVLIDIPPASASDMAAKRAYRVPPADLAHFRSVLSAYEGTHNYFNFTIGKKHTDKSANRYIMSFVSSEPFMREGTEWLSVKVKGQSFMLHQIRKMVGLAAMMVRTATPVSLVPKTFEPIRLNIPKAPALGLLLERPVFDKYNSDVKERSTDRDRIDFEPFQAEVDEFKKEWIYKAQIEDELRDNHFSEWLRVVDMNADDFAWYLTADGTINEAYKPAYIHQNDPRELVTGNPAVDGDDDTLGGDDE